MNQATTLPTNRHYYTDPDRIRVYRFCWLCRSVLNQLGWRRLDFPRELRHLNLEFWGIGQVVVDNYWPDKYYLLDPDLNDVELEIDWDKLFIDYPDKSLKPPLKRMLRGKARVGDPLV